MKIYKIGDLIYATDEFNDIISGKITDILKSTKQKDKYVYKLGG